MLSEVQVRGWRSAPIAGFNLQTCVTLEISMKNKKSKSQQNEYEWVTYSQSKWPYLIESNGIRDNVRQNCLAPPTCPNASSSDHLQASESCRVGSKSSQDRKNLCYDPVVFQKSGGESDATVEVLAGLKEPLGASGVLSKVVPNERAKRKDRPYLSTTYTNEERGPNQGEVTGKKC